MKKLFMPIVLVVFLSVFAFAADAALTSFTISGPSYTIAGQTGKPGDVAEFSYTITNTDATAVTVSFVSTQDLTQGTNKIALSSIASVTVGAGSTLSNQKFSVTIPSILQGSY